MQRVKAGSRGKADVVENIVHITFFQRSGCIIILPRGCRAYAAGCNVVIQACFQMRTDFSVHRQRRIVPAYVTAALLICSVVELHIQQRVGLQPLCFGNGIVLKLALFEGSIGSFLCNADDFRVIPYQKRILEKYCRDHGYTAIRHYDEDDGYSGTNFNRPGFQRMLADIKAGKIKRVVVKDMSRFGRNYLQVGMYTEMLFPEYGVHFIAVNDGVDSVHGDSYPHGKIYPSSAVYRLTFPTLFCIVCMGGYLPALRLKSLRAVFAFTEVRK